MQNGFQIEQIEENKSQGFIKLYRSFIKWEWYDDANVMRVFLHCLITANHETAKWRGNIIERGSLITSYAKIANELDLSLKKVRIAIKKLEKTEELSIESNNHFSIIKVLKYDEYQEKGTPRSNQDEEEEQTVDTQGTDKGQSKDIQQANEGQTGDTQGATNKNDKNIKNDKNNKKKNFVAKSFFQKLIASDDEIKKYNFLSDSFMRFLQYKTDIKKQYKTEDSVRSAFLKFVRLSNNNVEYAEALVENTIARGWQTIYDLPKEDKSAFLKNQTQQENQEVSDKWEKYSL